MGDDGIAVQHTFDDEAIPPMEKAGLFKICEKRDREEIH